MKKDKPALGIIDAKRVKNTDISEEKEYDTCKNVSGIKLSSTIYFLMHEREAEFKEISCNAPFLSAALV